MGDERPWTLLPWFRFLLLFCAQERRCLRTLKTEQSNRHLLSKRLHSFYALNLRLRSSPRLISTGQLHTLLHFHLRPINQIVSLGPYSI